MPGCANPSQTVPVHARLCRSVPFILKFWYCAILCQTVPHYAILSQTVLTRDKLLPNARIGIYRRAVRRKDNLEVTGEEKPKTRLRRRKASFTCLRRKKASLRRPRTKNYNKRHFAREKNRNLLAKILLILLISRTRNLESIY